MAFQLFDPTSEEYKELQDMIVDVEATVFNQDDLDAGLSLYDIEMAIESNPDYYAFFQREEDGETITKFDVERKLNVIKVWIYLKVRERSVGRKFNRFR